MRRYVLVRGKAWIIAVGCVSLIALAAVASPAQATFPGANGKISVGWGDGIRMVNPDGSGEAVLAPASAPRGAAKWSPDGQRFASSLECTDGTCPSRLATWAADGTDEQVVPNTEGLMPAWSNDAREFVYTDVQQNQLRAVGTDGTNDRVLETPPCGGVTAPDWSPDGEKVAYERPSCDSHKPEAYIDYFCFRFVERCGSVSDYRFSSRPDDQPSWSPDGSRVAFTLNTLDGGADVYIRTFDGGADQRLTTNPAMDASPAWSPDGTKIAFVSTRDDATCSPGTCRHAVYVMETDGTDQTRVSSIMNFPIGSTDWQALPVNQPSTYVRPAGATPVRMSLVPAMKECTTPNRVHGPSLEYSSCAPPVASSSRATIGFSGSFKSIGSLRFNAQVGSPGPPETSDIGVRLSITNVWGFGPTPDYTGELRASVDVHLTDKEPGGLSSTTQAFPLGFTVQCTATADDTTGSVCAGDTTVNAIVPGAVRETRRAIWALDQVRVYDGGADDDVDNGMGLFATQGIFVP